MKLKTPIVAVALLMALATFANRGLGADEVADLDADLELLQGSWELRHGNEGKGLPTIRSVKTISGNRETLRRFSIESGQLLSEKTVEFELHDAGAVRVFTFFPVGSPTKTGFSFVYKVEKDDFYDITGLLHGTEYRDYSKVPTMWRWKRVIEKPVDQAPESKTDKPAKGN